MVDTIIILLDISIPPKNPVSSIFFFDSHLPSSFHLTPEQKGIFGRSLLLVVLCFYADILNLWHRQNHSSHQWAFINILKFL